MAQSNDSLVSIPKWKLEKLLNSYFYILPACDSTVEKQHKAIEALNIALERSRQLDSVHVLQRDNKAKEAEILRKQASVIKSIHDQQVKQIKRQKSNMTLIAIGEAIVLIIIIL